MTAPSSGGRGLPHERHTRRFADAMQSLTRRLGGRLAFGGDYNPEQWPESVWPEDVALMREAGVNLVTVGVFSWALLEPKAGSYDFGWLDRILDLLHDNGIAVDLADASATPPPWFSREFPQSLPVDQFGVRRSYGGRQAFCPSSPEYRAAAAALTTAMVQRYAEHPAVAMWHVHNEYGCHNWSCYCDISAAAFRDWLRRRYSDLDVLNAAWGTTFWSQRYGDWDEILPPRRPAYRTFSNPTQQLDFARFSSDELLDCFRAEAAILRAHSHHPVTTNFMHFFKPIDYWRWAAEMDLISNDHYRIAAWGELVASHDLAMSADLERSLADGAPWLLMEHSTSAVNWQPVNPAKPAGGMRRDSLTHVARGADGALFFQWRASRAGAEKFHSGLLPHAGTDSAQWREVCALGADVAALSAVAGSTVRAEVAIVFDWESWWGVELDSHPSVEVDGLSTQRRWHRTLWKRGITCDFVHPERNLTGYQLLLVPSLYLVSDTGAANVAAAVQAGTSIVVGYFSGMVDPDDHIRLGGYPGAFRELLGIRVEEFSPLLPGTEVTVSFDGESQATRWTELIDVVSADVSVLATFVDGSYPGSPAVTVRNTGEDSGRAWYLATELDDRTLAAVLRSAVEAADVPPVLDLGQWPAGFDAVLRHDSEQDFLFAVNGSTVAVALDHSGTDLLTGRAWAAGDELAAGDVAVLALGPSGERDAGHPTA